MYILINYMHMTSCDILKNINNNNKPWKVLLTFKKRSNMHTNMYLYWNMFQQFKYICTTFYNLFFNCRTNRKYRSKIIYRIRTCLPFRARIVSTNYHQCWIDDQFEEKTLLKVSVTPIIKEFHCTYMFVFSLCHVLEYLYNWLLVYLSAKYY